MSKQKVIILNLISSLIFAILFFRNFIGVNLLIFNALAIVFMYYIYKPLRFTTLSKFLLVSVIITAIMVVVNNSVWAVLLNILFLFSLSTEIVYGGFRSYINNFFETIIRIFSAQISIFLSWSNNIANKSNSTNRTNNSNNSISFQKILFVIVIPILIFILFFSIYASASTVFYSKLSVVIDVIKNFLRGINIVFVMLLILGFIIGNVLYMKTIPVGLKKIDSQNKENLIRTKRIHYSNFKILGLKTKYLSGLVTLILLNILILYFNILDIVYVWFGFQWDGSFLKGMVHEGTWMLVFSILLSAGIALYYFRDNLNFYSKNKFLKILTLIWLIQNMIMTVSVVIRNYWYIYYFGLAYKRIAVMFFLLLVLFGLVSIIIKISKLKTSFYLLKVNSFAVLIVLLFSSLINWDVLIAKYNFSHANRSLIDFCFMAKLSNSALPYTYKTAEQLEEIYEMQKKAMPFDIDRDNLCNIYEYKEKLDNRMKKFQKKYEGMNFLEWNYAEYKAAQMLKLEK